MLVKDKIPSNYLINSRQLVIKINMKIMLFYLTPRKWLFAKIYFIKGIYKDLILRNIEKKPANTYKVVTKSSFSSMLVFDQSSKK